jgi:hypothetical protein
MDSFPLIVSDLTDRYSALWSETPALLPGGLRRFSSRLKAEREREMEMLMEKSLPRMDRYGEMEESDRTKYLGRAHTALGRLMTGDADPVMNRFFAECESVGKSFVRGAREADPSLSDDDIHQALRNQWVFNSIQSYLSHPVTLTSSSLGYSLMYPCTDNLLDDAVRTPEEKERFNSALTSCLEGTPGAGEGSELRGFPSLLRMIEEEYPRGSFPAVYESLCAIQRAQMRSLLLHRDVDGQAESYLRSLTIEKGGTSVAVDGYLVSGTLAPEPLHALFGYGVVLQFIDDLQDIPADDAAGHSTMFTRALRAGPLDQITEKLIHFTAMTIRLLGQHGRGRAQSLAVLIEGSCMFLILESIARYRHHFSDVFLSRVEDYSPLRFAYLGGLHDRVKSTLTEREGSLFPA